LFLQRGADVGQGDVEEEGLVEELLDGVGETALALGVGEDLALFLSNKDADAAAAFEEAVADQFLVGAGDSVGVDDERLGEDADGGELLAELELAEEDGAADVLDNLAIDGDVAGRGEAEGERHKCINRLVRLR